ncbi:MAG: phosphoenolpyruvate carboxykinase (GTP) [Methanomassiliicoccales archaeon]|nr:MAG: phosphoenolpyruvate carboxykinase (GTP) [Methanomassiliicoccales archaeon]
MEQEFVQILKSRLGDENHKKLMKINNQEVHKFIAKFVELCNPAKVFICTDSDEDIQYIKDAAIRDKGEASLANPNHTVHFDGYYDQARDKQKTKFLLPKGVDLGPEINAMDRDDGLKEIYSIMKNILEGHELFVKFFCLGPRNSEFTITCVQLTDSAYVAHSEDLLYRQGYEEFVSLGEKAQFFKFVHSQGETEEAGLDLQVSKNKDKRRVYIDLTDEVIYSANTQYGGNTIGLKKLAMRLAINRASKEGWLTEHMFITGVNGPEGRVSYFMGAYPSMCGKTSTAMIEGERIVGDDIAYLRNINGNVHAVNVEKGIFGIIEGINSTDDHLQWKALHSDNELIFSNVLVTPDKKVYWNGKDGDCPQKGHNHSGEWFLGKKDSDGKDITPSHKNARFTLDMKILDNYDSIMEDPKGVLIRGVIYGGRDSDTWVPVEEAFDWAHGIISKGAGLESETTAATLGKEGVRVFNPMSNLDFLSIPIGRYVQNNLDFGRGLSSAPKVFSVNYFLKDSEGNWLNHKNDKRIWLKWMELRVNGDADAIRTPTGFIPKYEDLKRLFRETYDKEYLKEDYIKQFTIRVPENLAKINRLIEIYKTRVLDTPDIVFKVLEDQRGMLEKTRAELGDYISPYDL